MSEQPTNHQMQLDLQGRVRNMPLPLTRSLLPLFEAVVNSIQAMPRGFGTKGRITVEIERAKELLSEATPTAPIVGFKITDNGEGFTARNFESFCRSDSREKVNMGGKGVGRLLWLKAFERVEITSYYRQADEVRLRSFAFKLSDPCFEEHGDAAAPSQNAEQKTVVQLKGFKPPYCDKCPRKLSAIATKVLEHCVLLLLNDDAPRIHIVDLADGERVSLNDLLVEEFRDRIERDTFQVGKESFFLVHLRTPTSQSTSHRVHYFANQREVLDESLSRLIPPLRGPLRDGGREFVWSTIVSGDYLDNGVDAERCAFLFPKERDEEPQLGGLDDTVTLSDIRAKVIEKTRPKLEALLAPVKEKNRARVEHYIEHHGFEYRVVLEYAPHVLDTIPADATDADVDAALHRARFEIDRRAREEFRKLNEGSDDSEELAEREEKILKTINKIGEGELARYVVHRKAVLEALQRRLARQGDGYSYESEVHRLICPMNADTNQIPEDLHNLWVIDERLPFHRYLASDRPLGGGRAQALKFQGGAETKAPDIFAAFTSLAFTESREEETYSTILIVEFKRPQRDGYSKDKNPISQVSEYVYEIRKGKAADANGRPIRVGQHTRFEAYIVCDVTAALEKYLEMEGMTPSQDGTSYRGYNPPLQLSIEVIPYAALLSNARKRNRAFFSKLHIPES